MKIARRITLTEEERTILNAWLRLPLSARQALRAKIILLAADGETNVKIARKLRASLKTVVLWRRRFLDGRLEGIEKEAHRCKRKSEVSEATTRLILQKMRERRWTVRSLATELGISPSMVYRVWKAYGLRP